MVHRYTRALLLAGGMLLCALDGFAQLLQIIPPNITSLDPVRNAVRAPRTTNVAVSFDQALNTTAETQQALKIFSAQAGGRKAGTATVSGATLTFNPAIDFKPGETVFATITQGVQNSSGASLAKPHVYQFTSAARASSGTFNGLSVVPMGQGPRGVVAGDVDGDGDVDLLAANINSNTVTVRLNDGAGSFSNSTEVLVGSNPWDVALGDVDADGDLDIITGKSEGTTVSVSINNGTGVFSSYSEVSAGNQPVKVGVADIDGDGDLDLLAGSVSSFAVRLNSGTGSFSAGSDVQLGIGPWNNMALGDVDADGDIDILVSSPFNLAIEVLLNNGAGNFSVGTSVPVDNNVTGLHVADIDGDGDLDILISINADSGYVSVRLNNGEGAFTNGSDVAVGNNPSALTMGDVEGDGDLDLLVANFSSGTVSLRTNDGIGNFGGNTEVQAGGPNLISITVADIDADGDLDLILGDVSSYVGAILVFNQDPPTLTGLTPTSGPVGSSVVIAGTGFSGTSSVTFNGTAASNFIVNSTTQITVSVPGGATTGPVLVSRGSLVSNGVPFTVTHAPIAAAQSVSINEDTPKNINLSGSDADGDALTYTIASSPAHGTLSGTGSARTYTPDANYNGPDSFTFTANDGALTSASATVSITVTAVNDAPVLANVPATASIPKQVLYTFTATASDPDGGARTFSLVNAPAGATINSTSGVFAWTPTAPQAGSTYTFSIRVSDGALSDSKPISLTVLNNSSPAAFTGFSPTAGPVGTQVNIAGSGLGAVTAVRFNGTNATFSLANSNKIVATVPAGATSGLISLSTASSTLTSSTAFTVTPAAPTISSFTPGSGPVGAQVTLTGTNLTGTTAVRFNGVSATTFTVQSATSLRMTVPAGATKGKITLTTPGGTAQSKDQFTVTNTAARLVATTPGLEQALQASPNPSPDKVYLRFALTEKQAYDLRVYDLRGALVKVLRSESAPAGQLQEVEWDASACAEGLYLIRLNSAGRSQVLKVMLSR